VKRYLSAAADGVVAGLAYIGLFTLVGPIPWNAMIASAVGVAVGAGVFRYVKQQRQGRA
jgi:xanthosine utilization system XapX-like protein